MKLLINTTEVLGGPYCQADDDLSDVQEYIKTEFEDFVDEGLKIGFGNFIDGSDSPDQVKEIAAGWNDGIRDVLAKQVNAMIAAPEKFALDSDASRDLYMAAKAADNRFSPWGEFGILHYNDCGWQLFEVVLNERTAKQIEDAPEDWAVVSLTVS